METCPNCGSALRPGTKFCTACGQRLPEYASPANGDPTSTWTSTQQNDTQTATPVASDSPAARFEQAISSWDTPARASETDSGWPAPPPPNNPETESTPSTPTFNFSSAASRNWDWGYTPETSSTSDAPEQTAEIPAAPEQQAVETVTASIAESAPTSSWESPLSQGWGDEPEDASEDVSEATLANNEWGASAEEVDAEIAESGATLEQPEDTSLEIPEVPAEGPVDEAGFHDGGDTEVDYLSGDENIDVSGLTPVHIGLANANVTESTDPHARAVSLVNELQSLMGQLQTGRDAEPVRERDEIGARIALSGVRAQSQDFSDLRDAVENVRANPRDIDALRDFAGMAGRVEALLSENDRLAQAIDDAVESLQ